MIPQKAKWTNTISIKNIFISSKRNMCIYKIIVLSKFYIAIIFVFTAFHFMQSYTRKIPVYLPHLRHNSVSLYRNGLECLTENLGHKPISLDA
jgi:hypothetical protein